MNTILPQTIDLQPTVEKVVRALKDVVDPEVGLNLVELGVIYGIQIERPRVKIKMTTTSPFCPLKDVLEEGVRCAVFQIPGVDAVDIEFVFDPPWNPHMISDEGHRKLSNFSLPPSSRH
jgi:metal-sulfur cluster biosynthetic enzyme